MKHLPFFALLFTLLIAPTLYAQWEPDVRLTYNRAESYTSYNNAWCVAASGDTVHVVWRDYRNNRPHLYYKRSTDGGSGWGPDTCFGDSSSVSYDPSVAARGSTVHIVWDDQRDGNYNIYYKRSTDGGTTWEPDVRLTSDSADSQHPSLAAADSVLHAVWEDYRGRLFPAIYYKRSTDGGTTWGPDSRLSDGPASSGLPAVAVSDLNVHVVWYDNRDGNTEIYHKRSTDGGSTWSQDSRLTYAPEDSWFPCLAVSGRNVHVVWNDQRDGNGEVYYKRSTDGGGTWSSDTNMTNVAAWSGSPSIAVSGPRVHLVYEDERLGSYNTEIYYLPSTDGGSSWGPEARLSNGPFYSDYPSIAVSGAKIHVVWYDVRVGYWEIFYKRNPTGNVGRETAGGTGRRVAAGLRPIPNPFISQARIPGHEAERFFLYDISGRQVGICRGDRIGVNLPPGVYFLRGHNQNSLPIRVVKVR